jgi:hypothetical protein
VRSLHFLYHFHPRAEGIDRMRLDTRTGATTVASDLQKLVNCSSEVLTKIH